MANKTSKELIRFTKHARERMAERKVPEELAKEAIFNPDRSEIGKDEETIAIKRSGKEEIRVAYLSLPNEIRVLSVMKRLGRRKSR